MRLLDVRTFKLHTFYSDQIPQYAILSHTWLKDDEEVTFIHLQDQEPIAWRRLPGAMKVERTCRQAAKHGFSWAWIDTCCINKSNSSELAEAINSMFKWYQMASVCYVYLDDFDIDRDDDFAFSRWWTRAWTLQELLAPLSVQFFDSNWQDIGTKADAAEHISTSTNIDLEILHNPELIQTKSIAQRMSWAARREATREEDLAYSLLGLFNINMSMQYGEGKEAFLRLQREIVRTSDDLSLFAWNLAPLTLGEFSKDDPYPIATINISMKEKGIDISHLGMYASHPSCFQNCKDVEFFSRYVGDACVEEQHGNLTLHAPMVSNKDYKISPSKAYGLPPIRWIALLPCGLRGRPHMLLGALLSAHNQIGLNSHGQPRSTRTVFKTPSPIATFLVDREVFIKAISLRVRVDSWASMLRLHGSAQATTLERVIVIKISTSQISTLQVVNKEDWRTIKKHPHILSQRKNPAAPDVTYGLNLKFAIRNPKQYLLVQIRVRQNVDDEDRICLQTEHISTPISESRSARWRSNHASIQLPGERINLFAKVETRIVYNQLVSTLTFKSLAFPETNDPADESVESADSAKAVHW